ncbi:MAG TPA: hypothetical protein PKK99_00300, partial [Bacteroidia bacterium]|nr:hypothetical protein [Bacteroidia bacterium]
MNKKKHKEQIKSPVQAYLLSEVFKTLNSHPNKTFNYKQLTTAIKPGFMNYVRETLGGDVVVEDLATELKKEILIIIRTLMAKGDLLEVERGKYKLKPKHAYTEGVIDISASGAAYLLSEN